MEKLDLQIGFPFENRMMHWDAAGSGVKCMPLALLKDHQSNAQQSKHSCGCTLPTTNSECSSLQKWEKCPTKQSQEKKNIQASTRPTPFLPQVFHVFLQRDRLMTYAKRPFAAGSGWKAVHGSASSKVRGRLQQGQWPRQPWGSPSSWWDILCVCACAFGHLEIVEISAKKCWDLLDLSRHVASLK